VIFLCHKFFSEDNLQLFQHELLVSNECIGATNGFASAQKNFDLTNFDIVDSSSADSTSSDENVTLKSDPPLKNDAPKEVCTPKGHFQTRTCSPRRSPRLALATANSNIPFLPPQTAYSGGYSSIASGLDFSFKRDLSFQQIQYNLYFKGKHFVLLQCPSIIPKC
jgi:hypothetical protein